MKPSVRSYFEYGGERFEAAWFDVNDKAELKEKTWQQVYAIGDVDGKVPVVQYANPARDPDNLPGGKTEPGETVGQTLAREMEEELNMRVVSWQPLGYQQVMTPDGRQLNQLRAYAKLEPIGAFERDPGGNVAGHRLMALEELNQIINYGEIGERMIGRAANFFNQK